MKGSWKALHRLWTLTSPMSGVREGGREGGRGGGRERTKDRLRAG
jgi:hypothetical protein